jgi:hypothetical protein
MSEFLSCCAPRLSRTFRCSFLLRMLQVIAKYETQRIRFLMREGKHLTDQTGVAHVPLLMPQSEPTASHGAASPNFFQRHLAFISSPRLVVMLVVYALIGPLVRVFLPPDTTDQCGVDDTLILGLSIPLILALVALGIKVRHVKEVYWITVSLLASRALPLLYSVCIY